MELLAYHEAGHALIAHYLGGRVRRVSIETEWDENLRAEGDTEVLWPVGQMTGGEFQEAGVLVTLAGPVAEMLYSGETYHPALAAEWANDWHEATRLAGEFIPTLALRMKYLEAQIRRLWKLLDDEPLWSALAALADALLAHETLDEEQVVDTLAVWLE
jgi:ATP-dependent Zn protease